MHGYGVLLASVKSQLVSGKSGSWCTGKPRNTVKPCKAVLKKEGRSVLKRLGRDSLPLTRGIGLLDIRRP
eukprot:13659377-Heterocapsa_arctica.AAC.1